MDTEKLVFLRAFELDHVHCYIPLREEFLSFHSWICTKLGSVSFNIKFTYFMLHLIFQTLTLRYATIHKLIHGCWAKPSPIAHTNTRKSNGNNKYWLSLPHCCWEQPTLVTESTKRELNLTWFLLCNVPSVGACRKMCEFQRGGNK